KERLFQCRDSGWFDRSDHVATEAQALDRYDVGDWELVLQTLARACGLGVPHSLARCYANPHHTFLVKRFDRTGAGRRLHVASAMTLTAHQDGDDASTDDHLRNHAFILVPGKGWRLSDAFDMNP